MPSKYSRVTSSTKPKAKYKKHHVHEVTTSLTEAKAIASDFAETKRYAYRATATLVGNASVRPYDPIYIAGLPNGMSGYWTVLKVVHRFNRKPAFYMLDVELGTDILGEENQQAYKAIETRDVNAELAGQNISPADSVLVDYSFSVNDNPLYTPGIESVNIKPKDTAVTPVSNSPDLYQDSIPDFSSVKFSTAWKATKGNKVL